MIIQLTAQDGEVHENIEANKVHDLARLAFEKALRHKFPFGNLEKPERELFSENLSLDRSNLHIV